MIKHIQKQNKNIKQIQYIRQQNEFTEQGTKKKKKKK